jgi:hypothetical protein
MIFFLFRLLNNFNFCLIGDLRGSPPAHLLPILPPPPGIQSMVYDYFWLFIIYFGLSGTLSTPGCQADQVRDWSFPLQQTGWGALTTQLHLITTYHHLKSHRKEILKNHF